MFVYWLLALTEGIDQWGDGRGYGLSEFTEMQNIHVRGAYLNPLASIGIIRTRLAPPLLHMPDWSQSLEQIESGYECGYVLRYQTATNTVP